MPNIYYSTFYMLSYPHLMAKHHLIVGRKSGSEAWNLPTWGCKSMVEGPTIMVGVFITLLYTHTMANNHYCSTYMLLYPYLMAKHCLEVGRKLIFFSNLRHETRQHGAVKLCWRDLQSCWECSSLCYTPIQCQTSTILAPACCYTPTWWPNFAWELAENWDFSWSEAWNPPTWGCKSMVEGPTIMLGVFITLLHTHTMPNIYYCSTCACCYIPTWWPNLSESWQKILIWGMKPANMGL